jgi:hypothetical protein
MVLTATEQRAGVPIQCCSELDSIWEAEIIVLGAATPATKPVIPAWLTLVVAVTETSSNNKHCYN